MIIYSLLVDIVFSHSIHAHTNVQTPSIKTDGNFECPNLYTHHITHSNGIILAENQLISESTQIDHLFVGDIISYQEDDQLDQVLIIESEVILQNGDIYTHNSHQIEELIQRHSEWILLHHDDFEQSLVGWNIPERAYCLNGIKYITHQKHQNADYFLHSNCAQNVQNLTKAYSLSPPHQHIKITAEVHVFGDWNGESIILQVDGKTAWIKSFTSSEDEIQHPCPHLQALSVPISIILEHKQQSVQVSFLSSQKRHPCDGSFGIDDVIISFK